jgi:hypothetical protein
LTIRGGDRCRFHDVVAFLATLTDGYTTPNVVTPELEMTGVRAGHGSPLVTRLPPGHPREIPSASAEAGTSPGGTSPTRPGRPLPAL